MRTLSLLAALAMCVYLAAPLRAQRERRDPLTHAQAEQIADASIDPDARIGLYTKFLNEHADALEALARRIPSTARDHQMEDRLQDFTSLMDELGNNLDTYGGRRADLRKSLKKLNEDIPRWQQLLHSLAKIHAVALYREDAVESSNDLASQAKQLLTSQTAYFEAHKKQVGQQRYEPPQ
jgi:exonuclease VII large subunit